MKTHFRSWIALLLCLSCFLMGGCKAKEPAVLQIAWVIADSSQVDSVKTNMTDPEETRINQYLTEQKKEYQIQITVTSIGENQSAEEVLKGYDLIYSPSLKLDQSELSALFMDLRPELESGKLEKLYQSMPQGYWDSLRIGSHIYNTVRQNPVPIHGMWITQEALEQMNLAVPEEVIGQPLENWKSLFQQVYEANQNKAFLCSPYLFVDDVSPVGQGYVWQAHFQMVAPHMGISYDHPELGVQCVYETEYAQKMNDLWKEFFEAGYVIADKREYAQKLGSGQLIMRSNVSYANTVYDPAEKWRSYPMQEAGYSSNLSEQLGHQYDLTWQVSAGSRNLEAVYQFLNDLATDPEMAKTVCIREMGVNLFTPVAQILNPMGGGDTLITGFDNAELVQQHYENIQPCPAPGFVLDNRNITEVQQQIENLIYDQSGNGDSRHNVILEAITDTSSWDNYESAMEEWLGRLNAAGLKEALSEANRQVTEYIGG